MIIDTKNRQIFDNTHQQIFIIPRGGISIFIRFFATGFAHRYNIPPFQGLLIRSEVN